MVASLSSLAVGVLLLAPSSTANFLPLNWLRRDTAALSTNTGTATTDTTAANYVPVVTQSKATYLHPTTVVYMQTYQSPVASDAQTHSGTSTTSKVRTSGKPNPKTSSKPAHTTKTSQGTKTNKETGTKPSASTVASVSNSERKTSTNHGKSTHTKAHTSQETTTRKKSASTTDGSVLPKTRTSQIKETTNKPAHSTHTTDTATKKSTQGSHETASTTTKGPVPLTTFSSVSVSVSTVKGETKQGHHSTVGSDHHTTMFPIVGGSHCFFCPPGGSHGYALMGMSAPGVYPPRPGPPGFPSSLPAITIGPNHDPTYSSPEPTAPNTELSEKTKTDHTTKTHQRTTKTKESKTKTGTCTKTQTASDCKITSSYGINTAGSTTTTFTTTACSTIKGCDPTGTTQTTKITPSSTSTCWKYSVAGLASDDSDGNTPSKRQKGDPDKPAGAGDRVEWIGNPKNKCTLKDLWEPIHPFARDVQTDQEKHSPPYKFANCFILKRDSSENTCAPVEYAQVSPESLPDQSATFYGKEGEKYLGFGDKKTEGKDQPFVNSDHVYELQTLKHFFGEMITKEKFSCNTLKEIFAKKDGDTSPALGQQIWNQLPSKKNPEFILMDKTVNRIKGNMFNTAKNAIKTKFGVDKKNPDLDPEIDRVSQLWTMAIIFDMMRHEQVTEMFQITNARVYQFLHTGFDGKNLESPGNKGWAPAYSSWMEDYVCYVPVSHDLDLVIRSSIRENLA